MGYVMTEYIHMEDENTSITDDQDKMEIDFSKK